MRAVIPNILSIAGSDPSGGAGIQADIKAISANGGYAMAALTALTAQNTQGVSAVHTLPPAFLAAQLDAVFADIRVDAVKVGMIARADAAECVAEKLAAHNAHPLVLDPVMIAKGGAPLLDEAAVSVLRERLLPLAQVLTPNLPEAAALLGADIAKTEAEMVAQGQALLTLGPRAVLMKGGHGAGAESADCLVTDGAVFWLSAPRIRTINTHGTGCSLSSALATFLGRGFALEEAARRAKAFISEAIGTADQLAVGGGHGPIHHFNGLWRAGSTEETPL